MGVSVRRASGDDWQQLWPLLAGMGTGEDEESSHQRFRLLSEDAAWLIVVAEDAGRLVGYAAAQDYGDHLRAGKEGRVAGSTTSTSRLFAAAPA